MMPYFVITYSFTDEDDWTETRSTTIAGSDAPDAVRNFADAIAGGDETYWGELHGSSPEFAGDDTFYVMVGDDPDEPQTRLIRYIDAKPFKGHRYDGKGKRNGRRSRGKTLTIRPTRLQWRRHASRHGRTFYRSDLGTYRIDKLPPHFEKNYRLWAGEYRVCDADTLAEAKIEAQKHWEDRRNGKRGKTKLPPRVGTKRERSERATLNAALRRDV